MCGIAGRVNYRTGAPVSPALVRGMCDLLAHRGPDGEGVWTDGHVGFGHRRLAVIDLSPAGRQPMTTRRRDLTVTFNGEIYNFLALRRELETAGHAFDSKSDTEVILAAYREWGIDCLRHFRGMFAFALWDAPAKRLFVARDRLGKKPLHYLLDREGIAFASEPKAFTADPSFAAEPDPEALSAYLSYQYIPSPMSAFKGVRKLPPAHYMVVEDGRITLERYWKLSYAPKRALSAGAAAEELIEMLTEAVRVRLISDVPLGAFLSGGVDSGAVVALMARLSGRPVKTFSIGFGEDAFNELPYARLVAQRYATDHHEFVVRPDAVQIVPELVWHYNEPYADPSAIPTYYLAQMARRHVTVALNGDAGDENFAGYRRYLSGIAEAPVDRLPAWFRSALHHAAGCAPARGRADSLLYRGKRWLRRMTDSPERRYARNMMIFDDDLKTELCDPSFVVSGGSAPSDLLLNVLERSDAADLVDAMLDMDVSYYLPDCLLVKVDIATMAHGLEGRSPMVDHEFMEWAARLPSDMKLHGQVTKAIFKRAVADLVPADIIERPKKGFSVPLAAWFRGELRELVGDLVMDGRLDQRGYFKKGAVRRLLEEHWRGAADWHTQLWTVLMLEAWHRTFVDTKVVASAAPFTAMSAHI